MLFIEYQENHWLCWQAVRHFKIVTNFSEQQQVWWEFTVRPDELSEKVTNPLVSMRFGTVDEAKQWLSKMLNPQQTRQGPPSIVTPHVVPGPMPRR